MKTLSLFDEETLSELSTNEKKQKTEINNSKVSEVIEYLNSTIGARYRAKSVAIRTVVQARLRDGYTIDDMKRVIDNKYAEWVSWGSDPYWKVYLRPKTIFRRSNIDGYLNQGNREQFVSVNSGQRSYSREGEF